MSLQAGRPSYSSEYVIRDESGHENYNVAGAPRLLGQDIPSGSRIEKKWGQLGYRLNGRWRAFPTAFYSRNLGSGLLGTLLGGSFSVVGIIEPVGLRKKTASGLTLTFGTFRSRLANGRGADLGARVALRIGSS